MEEEATKEPTGDVLAFGADAWVYCSQHMRAHQTGWCTVAVRDKIKLDACTANEARDECRVRGLKLYSDIYG
jgi:hypothetical protein